MVEKKWTARQVAEVTFITLNEWTDYWNQEMFSWEVDLNGTHYGVVLNLPTTKYDARQRSEWWCYYWMKVFTDMAEYEAAAKSDRIRWEDWKYRYPANVAMVWINRLERTDESWNVIWESFRWTFVDHINKRAYWIKFGTQKKDPTKKWLSFTEKAYVPLDEAKAKAKKEEPKEEAKQDELPF